MFVCMVAVGEVGVRFGGEGGWGAQVRVFSSPEPKAPGELIV